jgi:prevent-host-death family protein
MKSTNAVKTIEALEARIHFGSVMDEVEKKNTRFLVSKRGKPKIIILSVTDYLENILKEDELLTSIYLKTKETGLDMISEEEIEKEIRATRRKRSGKNR